MYFPIFLSDPRKLLQKNNGAAEHQHVATPGAELNTEPSTITHEHLWREPELMEKMLLYFERKNLFRCVSISIKIGGNHRPLTPSGVFVPLRNLVLKYPLLFSFPIGVEPCIEWKPLQEVLLRDVFHIDDCVGVDFKDPAADTRLLNATEMAENHRWRKPLWRMVYYSKTRWLTLYTAHCFTDGGSLVAYLKEFVEALNEADCGDSPLDAPGDVLFNLAKDLARLKHGISPVFFDRINFKPTLATRMATQSLKLSLRLFPTLVPTLVDTVSQRSFFVDKWSRPFFRRKRFFESDHIISPDSPLINAAPLFVNIAPLDVESLVVDCRRHQVKLQTFVLFVYLHTIHQVCPDMYTDLFRRITVAVSLRNIYPQLSNHNTYLGNTGRFDDGFYTFLVNYYINPHTPCTWDAVRKYHAFLHRTIKGATWINEYYTMAHAMNADHYLDPKINVRKDDCFLMTTNLGLVDVIDHADSGLYHIEDILFSPSAGAMVGTHHLTMCSTAKSGLNVGFSDGDTNIKDWPTFCLKFKENLLALRDEM